ncbi:hypothetical protein [Actinotalea sp. Marseille-Q4924]|uniref:hypothetical protein n=1 Tax=Actinotalea sp. Marseille-Q4924 TaxID=2866571 RepID=UPI001CE44FCE|nr:hypothetical protein [Actinotalea sp. Marseille-Q4924]
MAVRPHDPDGEPDDGAHDEEQGTARDADVDREWLEIVARLRSDADTPPSAPRAAAPDRAAGPEDEGPATSGPGSPGQVSPRPPAAGGSATPPPPAAGGSAVRPPGAASPTDPRAWSLDPEVEERETHFQPPDPGPVLGGDPLLTMAWGAVVGAPLLFLLSVTFWRSAPTVLLQVAAVLFVAGLGVLLWRMPHRRDDDDGPGAVV